MQVNEVVFSPSASHWATCSDDGSVRVWSLASMELLIQFQVLNQVLGAPGLSQTLSRPCLAATPSLSACPSRGAQPLSSTPGGVLMSPSWGSPELPLSGLEPCLLCTPGAAAGGSGLQ